jgi:phosphopantothenoylcysteine decarboxylase/phosphopantothenate--cysteine ligase
VLAAVAALPERPFTVGFAAETEDLEANALEKLRQKKLDMIVANLVGAGLVFEREESRAVVLWLGGRRELPQAPKLELARQIIALIGQCLKPAASVPTPIRRPRAS